MNKFSFIIFLILSIYAISGYSQELDMKITVNSDRIEGSDKTIFSNIEDALNQLVNNRKWTDEVFLQNERISSTMLITILSSTDNSYTADIQITSTRPVYNSSYTSPTFNFRDNEFDFNYIPGQNIEFSENNIDNNLTAVISYYVYIILGMDFDSFSLNGGKPYFEKAMYIATSAQSLSEKGWAPFGNDRNRYSLALSLTDDTSSIFHSMWYNYHRKGLDEMVANPTRGRTEIENTLPDLQKIKQTRPSSPIVVFWGDTKLEEVINIYTKANNEEKQNGIKMLESLYPSRRNAIERIKKNN